MKKMGKFKHLDKALLNRYLIILLGSFLFAFSVNALFIPHELLSGGLTGIAIMLEYLFGLPSGWSVAFLNIPLFLGGYRYVGKRFTYYSVFGTVCVSVFLFLTKGWELEVKSTMIAAIFGGLISGIGTGMVIRMRGSLGGVDILAVIINKYLSFSIGGINLFFNVIILLLASCFFSIEMAMYTMVAIFVANKAVDAVLEGFNHKKTLIIVSDKNREIANELFRQVRRGITFLNGQGAYSGKEKQLIYMVVRTMELSKVKDIVRKVDSEAFLTIIDTKEVEGRGFKFGDLF